MKQTCQPLALLFLIVTLSLYSCEKDKSCENCLKTNKPPVAVAGPDQTIALPASSVFIDGVASTDPDNNITSFQWLKISGPASFAIANATSAQTQVTDLVEGDYAFELRVTDDGGLFDKDTVHIYVKHSIGISEDESRIHATWWSNDLFATPGTYYWNDGKTYDLKPCGSANSVFVAGNDVYVSGNAGVLAGYWINGQRIDFSTLATTAGSVFVSGTDVYVNGIRDKPSAFPGRPNLVLPIYWKNGVITELSPNPHSTSSIFINGSDVYIAGDSLPFAGGSTPGYWKNGKRVNLSNAGRATSIFVSGTDVYVAGYNDHTPCYWKNGVKTDLAESYRSSANSIFVSGTDVYVAGTYYHTTTNTEVACYWKNGVRTDLPGNSFGSTAVCVFVSGTDVYVSGGLHDGLGSTPCYWKNGQRRDILGEGVLTSIFVK